MKQLLLRCKRNYDWFKGMLTTGLWLISAFRLVAPIPQCVYNRYSMVKKVKESGMRWTFRIIAFSISPTELGSGDHKLFQGPTFSSDELSLFTFVRKAVFLLQKWKEELKWEEKQLFVREWLNAVDSLHNTFHINVWIYKAFILDHL